MRDRTVSESITAAAAPDSEFRFGLRSVLLSFTILAIALAVPRIGRTIGLGFLASVAVLALLLGIQIVLLRLLEYVVGRRPRDDG